MFLHAFVVGWVWSKFNVNRDGVVEFGAICFVFFFFVRGVFVCLSMCLFVCLF